MRSLHKRLEALEAERAIDHERLEFYRRFSGNPDLPWDESMARPYEDVLHEMYANIETISAMENALKEGGRSSQFPAAGSI